MGTASLDPLALVLTALGALVALSDMDRERALAAHAAGIAGALVVSGGVAFVAYRRRTAELASEADGC